MHIWVNSQNRQLTDVDLESYLPLKFSYSRRVKRRKKYVKIAAIHNVVKVTSFTQVSPGSEFKHTLIYHLTQYYSNLCIRVRSDRQENEDNQNVELYTTGCFENYLLLEREFLHGVTAVFTDTIIGKSFTYFFVSHCI